MTRAVLALGSNMGDRAGHLRGAVAALRDWLLAVSPVYQTPPWGGPDQPAYLNAAVLVADPGATARDWLTRAWGIETAAGRVRDPGRRFGPRSLDVDVIAVWADDGTPIESGDPELTLPHPRAHLRAFVLRPWLDIEPDGTLPGQGRVVDLLSAPALADDLSDMHLHPDIGLESGR